VGSVPGPPEDISQVVLISLVQVLLLRRSMVEAAIGPFRASSSSEVNTEVGRPFLLELVSLGKASVDLWVAFVQRGRPLHHLVAVCQVLIIPNVVVVVPLNVSCVLLRLLHLSSGWPLHEVPHLKVSELLEQLVLSLEVFILLAQL